jgi:two-component system, NarL family, sensor histidine kinase UhpB
MERNPPVSGPVTPTRVLVVDDSQDDAVALSFELGRSLKSIETRWAEGVEQMYEAIEQWQPHIVLTDVYMPRFDIFSALAFIRTQWPLLPVVVVSGLVGEEIAARLIKAGASDFVAKPGSARLAVVIERELRDARQRSEKAMLEARLLHQEKLFARVLEHLPVGVWLCDDQAQVLHANPAALAIWGDPPESAAANFEHHKGWWAETGLPIEGRQWGSVRAARYGEATLGERIEIETLTGQRKVLLNSAVPMHDDDGQPIGCFVVHQDITALHHSEQRLRRAERTLRGLSQRLLEVQEQERRWIAQELHDDIGQAIAAMRFQLARIVDQSHLASARDMAADTLRSSEQLGDRLRQICLGLRPLELDDFGLMAALRSLIASLGHRPDLELHLGCDGDELRYPAPIETAAFRIAQEAIANALRHGGGSALAVHVQMQPDRLALAVVDNGCGFSVDSATAVDVRAGHLGLAGMEERARSAGGQLAFESQPGHGTTVRVEFIVVAGSADSELVDSAGMPLDTR